MAQVCTCARGADCEGGAAPTVGAGRAAVRRRAGGIERMVASEARVGGRKVEVA